MSLFRCFLTCSPIIVVGMLAAGAAAQSVPGSLHADAATVGLWRFQEGEGNSSACEGKGPAAVLHGATWVPGRDGFALATGSGYVAIPDAPELRPKDALTVEVWVKLGRIGWRPDLQERGLPVAARRCLEPGAAH